MIAYVAMRGPDSHQVGRTGGLEGSGQSVRGSGGRLGDWLERRMARAELVSVEPSRPKRIPAAGRVSTGFARVLAGFGGVLQVSAGFLFWARFVRYQ